MAKLSLKNSPNIVYLGFNSFKTHKRGVENVIEFQSQTAVFDNTYYISWGDKTKVYRYKNFICIEVLKCWYWPVLLNIVLIKLKNKKHIFIHGHNYLSSFFSIFKIDLFTVHDGLFYQRKTTKGTLLPLFYLIEKCVYLKSKKIHFISEFTKKGSLCPQFSSFEIISNTSHFENITTNLNLSNLRGKKVLIVRSIEERARLDLVLGAALKLKDYEFIIAGKGPLLSHYKSLVDSKKIENIEFLGYVSDNDLINHYQKCDVVLVTAEHGEGFGLPIIEGYLFNKPVIASNVCAIPEVIITEDYLFDNTICDIVNILKNHNKDLDFYSYYMNNFSNDLIVNKFKTSYEKLI